MGDILLYFINIKKAVSYIEKNLNIKISIRLLSAHCHMSQRNFCRIFKQVFGENPGVYIRRRRLTKAAEKLSSGKITVEKLTFDSGFGSEEVFYRAFKKQFGVTPAGFADRGGLYYAKKRGAMTEGYIKHLLSGGISIKPGIITDGPHRLAGISGKIQRGNSVFDAAVLFLQYSARKIISRCSSANPVFICISGGRGSVLFGKEKHIELFAGHEGKCAAGHKDRLLLKRKKYAVFTHKGPGSTLKYSCEYIFTVWGTNRSKHLENLMAVVKNPNFMSKKFTLEFRFELSAQERSAD